MPNNITNTQSEIGGGLASSRGGVLSITPIAPPPPPTGQMTALPSLSLLDVADWKLSEGFGESPLAKSGMLGATSSRRTGYSYSFEFDVILDLRKQPELSLRSIAGAEIYFRLGSEHSKLFNTGNLTIQPRYYWCPIAKLVSVSPVVDAANKKFVRQHVTGTASCHILLLPEMGDVTDTNTIAGAYAHFLRSNPLG